MVETSAASCGEGRKEQRASFAQKPAWRACGAHECCRAAVPSTVGLAWLISHPLIRSQLPLQLTLPRLQPPLFAAPPLPTSDIAHLPAHPRTTQCQRASPTRQL